jgi:predicted phosphoribosyltransferase
MPTTQAERQRRYIERHKHEQRRVNLHLDNDTADIIERISRDRGIAKGAVVAEAIRAFAQQTGVTQ